MFDSVHIDDLQVTGVRRIRGLGSPTPRRDVTLKSARHGATDRTLLYDGRVLDVEGIIRGETALAAWQAFDAIKGALQLGATRTIKIHRTGFAEAEQAVVVVASPVDDGVSYEEPKVIRWGVSLHAPDPRLYGAVLRVGSYDPTEASEGGGTEVPFVFPLEFETSTATHLAIVNGGNTGTPPVLTVHGPVVNPVIDNDTLGLSIAVTYALGASDQVEVDVAERTIKLNGTERLDLLNAQDTVWWELAAGTNRLRLRGSGMVADSTALACQYRDARI